MAKERMVTRTIEATVGVCMVCTVSEGKVDNKNFKITGKFTDNSELLKELQKQYDTFDNKIVAVISSEIEETLYGMPENDFIRYATVLPPRGTKTI